MRLIDADALLKSFDVAKMVEYDETGCGVTRIAIPVQTIKDAPTIYAVPVVRCKECRHNEDEDYCPFVRVSKGANWLEIIKPHADGFCYKGEKMDGGAEG